MPRRRFEDDDDRYEPARRRPGGIPVAVVLLGGLGLLAVLGLGAALFLFTARADRRELEAARAEAEVARDQAVALAAERAAVEEVAKASVQKAAGPPARPGHTPPPKLYGWPEVWELAGKLADEHASAEPGKSAAAAKKFPSLPATESLGIAESYWQQMKDDPGTWESITEEILTHFRRAELTAFADRVAIARGRKATTEGGALAARFRRDHPDGASDPYQAAERVVEAWRLIGQLDQSQRGMVMEALVDHFAGRQPRTGGAGSVGAVFEMIRRPPR